MTTRVKYLNYPHIYSTTNNPILLLILFPDSGAEVRVRGGSEREAEAAAAGGGRERGGWEG